MAAFVWSKGISRNARAAVRLQAIATRGRDTLSSSRPTSGWARAVGSAMTVTLTAAKASLSPICTRYTGMAETAVISANPKASTVPTSTGAARTKRSRAPAGACRGRVRVRRLRTAMVKATSAT